MIAKFLRALRATAARPLTARPERNPFADPYGLQGTQVNPGGRVF